MLRLITLSHLTRSLAVLATICSFALIGVGFGQEPMQPTNSAQASSQPQATTEKKAEQAPNKPDEKDERLQQLLGQVEALQKELEALRGGSGSSTSAKKSASASRRPAERKAETPKPETTKEQEAAAAVTQPDATASIPAAFNPDWIKSFTWRCIGPAAMGGRIVQIATVDSDPCCYYVAAASGGLFKTTNYGTTFVPVFDHENTVSIGDIAIAPSNPQIVWVGTGEHNARNSVSWGDGVYKSTDAGKTWQNVGLKNSYQIGRIAVHPRNPDIAYVGVLGRLWGENEERGVYKTIDGGKTWERALYVDAKTGCIDLVLNPDDPEIVVAAMYERQRGIYDDGDPIKRWGPGSGLFRSVNGGKEWVKLTQGLPSVQIGRIGLSIYKKNPKVVYAIMETEKIGTGPRQQEAAGSPAYMGIQGEGDEGGAKLNNVIVGGPAEKAGLKEGDIVVELDARAVVSYPDLTSQIQSHKAGDTVRLKVQRDNATKEMEVTLGSRSAGGGEGGAPASRSGAAPGPYSSGLGGQRENSQDKQGDEGFQTGGVYRSEDAGQTWKRVNSLNPRPFYFSRIQVDPNDDGNVYVLGISSYKSSDGGKTFSSDLARGVHSDHHALWIDPRDGRHLLLGGDGGLYATHDRGATWEHVNIMPLGQFYHVAVDTRRPYRVYGGLQDNGSWGGPSMTRGRGPTNEDWMTVGSGDGFTCQVDPNDPDLVYYTSQYGNMGRINVRTGERHAIRPQAEQGQRFRFNWKTPFVLSNHNSKIFYAAGNYVLKSLDRGDKLRTISPRITGTERGTASALAESPLNPDLLFVGTDDGALWVTRNGGHGWSNISEAIQAVPANNCIASIEPSRFKEGRCYIAIDAHRADSTAPFLFVTEDYGATWASLRADLPDGSARTLREDIQNENLLYLGTEFGAWMTINRGNRWIRLNNNLPTVAVHDFAQPRTANELVAATHGRSIWILDVNPLRQLTAGVALAPAHLFRPAPATTWGNSVGRSLYGHKRYTGENPADGAAIHYMLSSSASDVKLRVLDADGKMVRELSVKKEAGLHRSVWDLRRVVQRAAEGATTVVRQGTQGTGSATTTQGASRVSPGQYRIVLTVDGREFSESMLVQADPQFATSTVATEEDEDDQDDW